MDEVTLNQLLTMDIKGKVICFPTDTVYGVGAMIDDQEAISKIYHLKHRDLTKPLAVLTGTKDINKYVDNINEQTKKLIDKYWPGALTLILKKNSLISDYVTSNLDTVGLRMPNSKIALQILNKFGLMATTSINISGMKPLNTIEDIKNNFSDYIDYLVVNQEKNSNVSSTVVDVSNNEIKILRQGDIIIK